jgi:hypothetical protein
MVRRDHSLFVLPLTDKLHTLRLYMASDLEPVTCRGPAATAMISWPDLVGGPRHAKGPARDPSDRFDPAWAHSSTVTSFRRSCRSSHAAYVCDLMCDCGIIDTIRGMVSWQGVWLQQPSQAEKTNRLTCVRARTDGNPDSH